MQHLDELTEGNTDFKKRSIVPGKRNELNENQGWNISNAEDTLKNYYNQMC